MRPNVTMKKILTSHSVLSVCSILFTIVIVETSENSGKEGLIVLDTQAPPTGSSKYVNKRASFSMPRRLFSFLCENNYGLPSKCRKYKDTAQDNENGESMSDGRVVAREVTKSSLASTSPIIHHKSGRHHYENVAQTKGHDSRLRRRRQAKEGGDDNQTERDDEESDVDEGLPIENHENPNEENHHYRNNSITQLFSFLTTIAPDVLQETSITAQISPNDGFREFSEASTSPVPTAPEETFKKNESYDKNIQKKNAKKKSEKRTMSTESTDPLSKHDGTFRYQKKFPMNSWRSLGFYDDSYLESINNHWLQFEPTSSSMHNVFAVLYGVFMVVGCGGNLLVIFMFVRCRSLRTPPNYLIVNLAISDFIMMAKTPIFIVNSLYHGPALGALGCKIYGFIGGLTGTASIMTLASIALDRYYVIVHPLNPFKRTTSRRAMFMIIGVWMYAATFSSIPLYWVNNYTSEGFLTSCSFDYLAEDFGSRLFIFVFFLAAWLLPLIIITFSYISIFRIVREAGKLENFGLGKGVSTGESFKFRPDEGKQKTEVKIAMLAAILISLWLLAWTPYALVALCGIFGWKDYITPLVSSVPALFCKTASCIDPFVYFMNHPRFQKELRFKFKICFCYHQQKRSLREGSCYSAVTFRCDNDANLKECQELPSVASTMEMEPPVMPTEDSSGSGNSSLFKENSMKRTGARINATHRSSQENLKKSVSCAKTSNQERSKSFHYSNAARIENVEAGEMVSRNAPIRDRSYEGLVPASTTTTKYRVSVKRNNSFPVMKETAVIVNK